MDAENTILPGDSFFVIGGAAADNGTLQGGKPEDAFLPWDQHRRQREQTRRPEFWPGSLVHDVTRHCGPIWPAAGTLQQVTISLQGPGLRAAQ